MAKKNKTIQLQSPENYIRTRARNLEIYECLINDGWKEGGMATVMVSRKHTNGNVTFAIYLVDLYCLGVKDTLFLFNVSELMYRQQLQRFYEMDEFTKIEYKLAHNIIYAAVEFAGDYGFIPDKLFTNVTQYLLEEDTEDIELIDIECGLHGKPAYFQGPNDNQATIKRILNQLERTAGRGNYNYTLGVDDLDSANDLFRYDEDTEHEEIDDSISYEETVGVFRQYEDRFDSLNKEETESFLDAVEVLFKSLVIEDVFDRYYDDFIEDMDIEYISDEIPDEMLGLPISENRNLDYLKTKLSPILELSDKKFKKAMKLTGELKKEFGDVPFLTYLELHFEEDKSSKGFKQKLTYCEAQFPDYPLIKISSLIYSFLSNLEHTPDIDVIPLHSLFPDRNLIHEFEMQQYLVYATFVVAMGTDKSRLSAFYEVLSDLDFPDEFMELTYILIITEKIKSVQAMLEKAN